MGHQLNRQRLSLLCHHANPKHWIFVRDTLLRDISLAFSGGFFIVLCNLLAAVPQFILTAQPCSFSKKVLVTSILSRTQLLLGKSTMTNAFIYYFTEFPQRQGKYGARCSRNVDRTGLSVSQASSCYLFSDFAVCEVKTQLSLHHLLLTLSALGYERIDLHAEKVTLQPQHKNENAWFSVSLWNRKHFQNFERIIKFY